MQVINWWSGFTAVVILRCWEPIHVSTVRAIYVDMMYFCLNQKQRWFLAASVRGVFLLLAELILAELLVAELLINLFLFFHMYLTARGGLILFLILAKTLSSSLDDKRLSCSGNLRKLASNWQDSNYFWGWRWECGCGLPAFAKLREVICCLSHIFKISLRNCLVAQVLHWCC